MIRRLLHIVGMASLTTASIAAQTSTGPQKEPPPAWELQLGASYVATSGNTDTSSTGADFGFKRRWIVWQLESAATAVRASNHGVSTAERYLGSVRGQRALSDLLALTTGFKAERDRFAGLDFRSILDAGLTWALVRQTLWTLDGLTALTYNHENPVRGVDQDNPGALLQALSKLKFSDTADTTQRFSFYPNFQSRDDYRSEAELTLQAALNKRLALKLGYLFRYDNLPVPGFEKTDNTTTASIVLKMQAAR
jgi:putative salt-induced outer membrane protein